MRLALDQFLGAIPRRDPRKLPTGGAQRAENVHVSSGALRPTRAPRIAATFAGETVNDFIVHGGTILPQDAATSAAPGPVDGNRLYIATEGTAPRLRLVDTDEEMALALPTPDSKPGAAIEQAAPDPAEGLPPLPIQVTLFCWTWVSDLGEESLPSPASDPIDVTEGSTVEVTLNGSTPPVGSRITKIRVYRSQVDATGQAAFYFVGEVSAGATTYISDLEVDPLQEPLPSGHYDPPRDDMKGLTPLWNGMIAGHRARTLCFCEPFLPHAWPRRYELTTDYEIVGLARSGSTLIVLTKGTPYVAQGSSPDTMLLQAADVNLPCSSAAGIVDLGIGVAYPTFDGLVLMQGATPSVVTRDLFGREEWQALDLSSISASHFDGKYVFAHGAGGTVSMIDLAGETPGLITTGHTAKTFAYDLMSGKAYFCDGGEQVREWADADGEYETLTWDSGIIQFANPVLFGALLVEGRNLPGAGSAPFSITITVDGAQRDTITSLNEVERLSGGWGREWEISVTGRVGIERILMAGTPTELVEAR